MSTYSPHSRNSVASPHVLIIGGGLAGLTAARLLHRAGIGFQLLEARDRLGGRILSADASGNAAADGFDLGPSWFWPAVQPAMAALVAELGVSVFPQDSAGDIVFQQTLHETPLRFPGMPEEWPSMRIAGGAGALVSALAAGLPAAAIQLNARVTRVTLDGEEIELRYVRTNGHEHRARASHVLFALPPHLQQELGQRLARAPINRYPGPAHAVLTERLAAFCELPAGCRIMLGNGSDELIDILSVACNRPGATVLAPLPGFVMYEMSARLRGLSFVAVPLTSDFALDEAAMLDAIARHRPALTYLAYPNNPSANLFDDAVIAYQPFSSRTRMASLAQHEHVLVLRTLSKFGLAGVRLGYLCGAAPLIDEIDKVRPPYNVSVLNAEAALFALDHADEYARQAALLRAQRERLQAALRTLPGVRPYPSEANMILVRVPDSARAFQGMKARGVLVKHVAALHPLLADCLRLTIGTPEENVAMFDALKASL